MSDESAELMQLDPERHVTARSCVELRHTRATADERRSPPPLSRSLLVLTLVLSVFSLCMLLTRAPHVLYTQQHSRLSFGRSMPLVVHILKLLSTTCARTGARQPVQIKVGADRPRRSGHAGRYEILLYRDVPNSLDPYRMLRYPYRTLDPDPRQNSRYVSCIRYLPVPRGSGGCVAASRRFGVHVAKGRGACWTVRRSISRTAHLIHLCAGILRPR